MNFYLYKITNTNTGEYYIGRSSCFENPEDHDYFGSGDWIRNLAMVINGFKHKPPVARRRHFTNNPEFVKEIIMMNDSHSSNLLNENIIIGDLWFKDKLCMNKIPGGIGLGNAESHPRYDDKIYVWINKKTKEKIYKSQYGMTLFLGGYKCNVNSCVIKRKHCKSVRGWYFAGEVGNEFEPNFRSGEDFTKYIWTHPEKGSVYMTRKEIQSFLKCKRGRVGDCISPNQRKKSIMGWVYEGIFQHGE